LEEPNPAANTSPRSRRLTSAGHGKRAALFFAQVLVVINNHDYEGKSLIFPLVSTRIASMPVSRVRCVSCVLLQCSEGIIALQSSPLTAGHPGAAAFLLCSLESGTSFSLTPNKLLAMAYIS